MIIHTENPKDIIKNLVVLIKIPDKAKGHKTNKQKLNVYILANRPLKKLNNQMYNSIKIGIASQRGKDLCIVL